MGTFVDLYSREFVQQPQGPYPATWTPTGYGTYGFGSYQATVATQQTPPKQMDREFLLVLVLLGVIAFLAFIFALTYRSRRED